MSGRRFRGVSDNQINFKNKWNRVFGVFLLSVGPSQPYSVRTNFKRRNVTRRSEETPKRTGYESTQQHNNPYRQSTSFVTPHTHLYNKDHYTRRRIQRNWLGPWYGIILDFHKRVVVYYYTRWGSFWRKLPWHSFVHSHRHLPAVPQVPLHWRRRR